METIREKAQNLFDRTFNSLNFELLKAGAGEDKIIEYIERPDNRVLEAEVKDNYIDEEWQAKSEEEKETAIDDWYLESEHYPMWNTIFEAKDNFTSEKIIEDIDGLYKLGIGVIAPTDYTLACLFIAGAGYDFYDHHWIPLFKRWGWLKEDEKV